MGIWCQKRHNLSIPPNVARTSMLSSRPNHLSTALGYSVQLHPLSGPHAALGFPPSLTRREASLSPIGKHHMCGVRNKIAFPYRSPSTSLQSFVFKGVPPNQFLSTRKRWHFVFRASRIFMLTSSMDRSTSSERLLIWKYIHRITVLTLAAYYMIAVIYTTNRLPSLIS
jgi:hypothetical protein